MNFIQRLFSSTQVTASEQAQTEVPSQPAAQQPTSMGIASNKDLFETAVPKYFDFLDQRPQNLGQLPENNQTSYESSSRIGDAAIAESETAGSNTVGQLSERLQSLKERSNELKNQIVALSKELGDAEASGNFPKVIELSKQMEQLKSELANVESEIKEVMQQIEKLHAEENPIPERVDSVITDLSNPVQFLQPKSPDQNLVAVEKAPSWVEANIYAKKDDDDK